MYVFDSWTATNAATGKSHTVKTNLYVRVSQTNPDKGKAGHSPLSLSTLPYYGGFTSILAHIYLKTPYCHKGSHSHTHTHIYIYTHTYTCIHIYI